VAGLFALAAVWLYGLDDRLANHRALTGLRLCGLMCYSLYLIHLPVSSFVHAGLEEAGINTTSLSPFLTIALCGTPAIWLSWRFHTSVERRFMSGGATPGAVPVRVTPASTSSRLGPATF
jgi:peptidoglycan/LPS O-acetylase OafA/YrhL